jgi:hypothetical protein
MKTFEKFTKFFDEIKINVTSNQNECYKEIKINYYLLMKF